MKTRVISAFVGFAIFCVVAYFFETIILDLAIAFLSAVAAHELIKCVGLSTNKFFEIVCLIFAISFSTVYFNIFSGLTLLCEFIFAGIIMLFVLKNYNEVSAEKALFVFASCTLVPRAFSIVLLFREYDKPISYMLVFLSFCIAWFSDIFAFFVGKYFGKHKLCQNISPKKTVEGFLGGIICSALLCIIGIIIVSSKIGVQINYFSTVIFALVGPVISVFGDLSASIIKRQSGIKDYGTIMPGHGGIMDRFDSWIFVAPFLYIWNIYFPLFNYLAN